MLDRQLGQRESRMLDHRITHLVDLLAGPKSKRVVLTLRRRVDPTTLIPAERKLLLVLGDEVLTDLRSDRLEEVSQVTEHRKVVSDRTVRLQHIADGDQQDQGGRETGKSPHRMSSHRLHAHVSSPHAAVCQLAAPRGGACRRSVETAYRQDALAEQPQAGPTTQPGPAVAAVLTTPALLPTTV